jgi:hypothetical protein
MTVKKQKQVKLSNASIKVYLAFDEAARDWGWQSDQGVSRVEISRQRYTQASLALENRIFYLEAKNRTLSRQLKNHYKARMAAGRVKQ